MPREHLAQRFVIRDRAPFQTVARQRALGDLDVVLYAHSTRPELFVKYTKASKGRAQLRAQACRGRSHAKSWKGAGDEFAGCEAD